MGFLSRLFRRAVDERVSTNLVPGDLAVCIRDDWIYPQLPHPEIGEVRLVTAVADITFPRSASGEKARQIALQLGGYGDEWFSAHAFRKAIEDNEPADEEFTTLIKQPIRKPAKTPVKAR